MNDNLNEKFFEIKNYSKYLISKEGLVFNKEKNTFLKGSINPKGYKNFRLINDDGYTYTFGLHRLLCYVFKYDSFFDNAIVNHIDGNKYNNNLNNLEWVSYKENIWHAGKLNLTSKCIPIQVKDLKNNFIYYFNSVNECALFFNVSKDSILYRIKFPERKIWPELKQYRIKDMDKDWKEIIDLEKELKNLEVAKSVMVKFLLTNEIKIFNTLSNAALFLNKNISTFYGWINKKNQPVLPGLIQIKYTTDNSAWRKIIDPYLELEKTTNVKVVKVTNISNGKIYIFENCVSCAKKFNISTTVLNYRLNTNKKIFNKLFIFEYYSNGLNKE